MRKEKVQKNHQKTRFKKDQKEEARLKEASQAKSEGGSEVKGHNAREGTLRQN